MVRVVAASAGGVGVAAVPVPLPRGVRGVGGVGLVRVLLSRSLRARACAPGAAAAHQVLRLPVRGARPVGAGRRTLQAQGEPRSVPFRFHDRPTYRF